MFKLIVLSIGISGMISSCSELNQPAERVSKKGDEIGKVIEKLGNQVSVIFQDSQNNYWFSHQGVVRYDGKTLIQFTTDDGLYANSVHTIQEDHLGNIYFDTGEGINKYDGKTIEKLIPIDDPVNATQLLPNDLWFAGNWDMNGVYRYDGSNLYRLELAYELEQEARDLFPSATFSFLGVYSTFKDTLGNVWLGGSTLGACRFDGSEFFWISEREMTELDHGPAMGIRSIVQDSDGCLYFGSNVNSKYRIVELDGGISYEKLPGIDTSQDPDLRSACISMILDDEGVFWMAHYKAGVWKYDGESFTHYSVKVGDEEAEIFSIYKDQLGHVWLGTHNAGAWKFNGTKFERFYPF